MIDQDRDGVDDLKDLQTHQKSRGKCRRLSGSNRRNWVCRKFDGRRHPNDCTNGWYGCNPDSGFLQTNFIAAVLPDTFRWLQFLKRNPN